MQFRQSIFDYPLTVKLGEKLPFFGLYRYRQGLRFVPPDDESFTLRGDKQRLLYKGRRQSHRFTILGDTSFEYDCILEREPESNAISLLIDGAEHYDFFRQPDFVQEPFLRGSYAVYKKVTLVGEGTGKLCHIHRPLIIDALGRRCWGELAVVGNVLRITIPEWWLAGAKYPVVVDPTIGTSTVGSQYLVAGQELFFDRQIPVNRFLVPETINGKCTASFYTYKENVFSAGYPAFYSDNGNKPYSISSYNADVVDLYIYSYKGEGWRDVTFSSFGAITSGSNIWFGLACSLKWYPRFDYGSKCYVHFIEDYYLPNTYPNYNGDIFEDYKLSMYFSYTSPQSYVRTVTQGVMFADSLKLKGNYQREISQNVQSAAVMQCVGDFFRQCVMIVMNGTVADKTQGIIRTIAEHIDILSVMYKCKDYLSKITDMVQAEGRTHSSLLMVARIITNVFIRDYVLRRFLIAQEELLLKSTVTTELILDSRID